MNHCTNCGAQLKSGEKFCTSCNTKTVKKKTQLLVACIIAGVVLVFGIAAAFIVFPGNGVEDKGEGKNGKDHVITEEPSESSEIPNAARMKIELSQDGRSFIPNTQSIDSVEILSEEIVDEDEPWVYNTTVLINSSDSELAYVKYGAITYHRNEEEEWILISIDVDKMNLWTISPLVGANESLIESSASEAISLQTVTIDGDEWKIDDDTIESITISSQNTNLESRKDVAIVTVVLGSEARTAQGQVELEFVFDDGWSFSNHIGHTPFISEYRPSAIFDLTEEHLMDELVRNDASILREMNWATQTITMTRDEISNFNILDYESSNKGADRVYNFTFDLDKDFVVFAVDAKVSYSYDSMSGWVLGEFSFAAEVKSAALEGTSWAGMTLPWSPALNQRHIIFEILEIADDGAVRVRISATERTAVSTLLGFIDYSDLSITLTFEEWIIEPDVHRNDKDRYSVQTVRGHILVDDYQIFSPRSLIYRGVRVTLTDDADFPAPAPEPSGVIDDDDETDEG